MGGRDNRGHRKEDGDNSVELHDGVRLGLGYPILKSSFDLA